MLKETENYAKLLELRLKEKSDALEELHMEAAIDAQLTNVDNSPTACIHAEPSINGSFSANDDDVIFDDYKNSNSVKNCLSPYVPSESERIIHFLELAGVDQDDVLLDIGCGDGRVCTIAAKEKGCKAIGIDVSPPCINTAKEIAKEELSKLELDPKLCTFYQADMTISPVQLLDEKNSVLFSALKSCTVIFLYTYPTLLLKLIPLLDALTANTGKFRAKIVGTLTYHLPDENVVRTEPNFKCEEMHDIRLYSRVVNNIK